MFIDKRSALYAEKLYEGLECDVLKTSLEAAEFVQYIDNTWHALKVAVGNEVGLLCKSTDIDSHEVMDNFAKNTKLNLSLYYLKSGFAFGGSCLPKDTQGTMHMDYPIQKTEIYRQTLPSPPNPVVDLQSLMPGPAPSASTEITAGM